MTSFKTAIELLDAAQDPASRIYELSLYAGTHEEPSFSLLMGARHQLLQKGWTRGDCWKIPDHYKKAWAEKKIFLMTVIQSVSLETEGPSRTDDELDLIMACFTDQALFPSPNLL